jgi:glycosyltransferase involved in cell wall biosynthesis
MPDNKIQICHLTINPIDYERRIQNQAGSAVEAGYAVRIFALGLPGHGSEKNAFSYPVTQIRTPFYRGGILKFLHFNWKIFWLLLFQQIGIIHCHDLWLMPAASFLTVLKKNRLIYDAHEYYAGLEIFNHHRLRRKIWMILEQLVIPSIDVLLTVSEPLADLYRQKYRSLKAVEVIRNLPKAESGGIQNSAASFPVFSRPVIIYQGHFRPGRGLANLIHAIALTEKGHLLLVGGGELEGDLKNLVAYYQLEKRITFFGYVPNNDLISLSAQADLGVVLFEPTCLNYAYALPNKFFEYIMAGIPVLASDIDTFQAYISQYELGMTVDPSDIQAIAARIRLMLSEPQKLSVWRNNARLAAKELNWNRESLKMNAIYERFGG